METIIFLLLGAGIFIYAAATEIRERRAAEPQVVESAQPLVPFSPGSKAEQAIRQSTEKLLRDKQLVVADEAVQMKEFLEWTWRYYRAE